MHDVFHPELMKNKTCFMSGATSGINQQIALRFARAGAKVFVMSRSQDKVDATVEMLIDAGAQAAGIACDVRSMPHVEEAVKACTDQFGKIDMVLAGQAGNFVAAASMMSSNGFKTVMDIDLLGSFNVFRACMEHMNLPKSADDPHCSMIAITAPQATLPMPMQVHVCAAKAGVNMMVKCLALEWSKSGIRVNAISPGPIDDTEGMKRLAVSDEIANEMKNKIAMQEWGTKDDIADCALWLSSPAARYVTGSIVEVEGGTNLGDASMIMKI